jgi:hypothetical protein
MNFLHHISQLNIYAPKYFVKNKQIFGFTQHAIY